MRFMIIVKSTPEFEAETTPQTPDEKLMKEMADYHEELSRAGVLLDGSGLQPSRKGWRIHYNGQKRTVIDGPFAEAKELIAGFTTIQVRSREEAMEWSRRYPNPVGENEPAVIEVRQLYELDDFTPSDQVERFREMNTPSQK
ncbi:YciI family protein [Polaromonas sp.]|uniref:YciI family protein n=1 Tax=Polaromonas sp. TaxID=1869339 RepID=UPI003CBD9E21